MFHNAGTVLTSKVIIKYTESLYIITPKQSQKAEFQGQEMCQRYTVTDHRSRPPSGCLFGQVMK